MIKYTKIFLGLSLLLISINAFADSCLSNNDVSNFIKDKSSEELSQGGISGPNGWLLKGGGACTTNKFKDFQFVSAREAARGTYHITCIYITKPSEPGCSSGLRFLKEVSANIQKSPTWQPGQGEYLCGKDYSGVTSSEQCSW